MTSKIPIELVPNFPPSVLAFSTQRIRAGSIDGNLGLLSKPGWNSVFQDRYAFFERLGLSQKHFFSARQVHSTRCVWVEPHMASSAFIDVDGILSGSQDSALFITTADCIPIFLASKNGSIIGLVHAGWQGTEGKILHEAIVQFNRAGIPSDQVLIHLGPGIKSCCFEVTQELVSQFQYTSPTDATHWSVDLYQENRKVALHAGVLASSITESPHCTGCRNDLYFSFRKEKPSTGRMLHLITLMPSFGFVAG